MEHTQAVPRREPWNKGKIVGQKSPLKLKDIWALRVRLQIERRIRELALFNLGIVRWQGLKDPKGAIEAWERLLKTNPNYEQKEHVRELMERAKAHGSMG